jgi:ATPase subunit of ABC transporter with duplicated ATPase domains
MAAYDAHRDEVKRLERLIKQKTHNTRTHYTASDNDKFVQNIKQATAEKTVSKNIRDAKQRLDNLADEDIRKPNRPWRVGFEFDPLPLPGDEPIRLRGISKSFGGRAILRGVTATIYNGDRIALVAPNGSGKTTLLQIIAGVLAADSGELFIAPTVKTGYLDQEQETLDLGHSVVAAYRELADGSQQEILAQIHKSGLFADATLAERSVSALSVGQRRKLQLSRLVASRANILLLDEPTNHLDLTAIEALEYGLRDFTGAMLIITHDRWLIDKLATRVWHLENGQIVEG